MAVSAKSGYFMCAHIHMYAYMQIYMHAYVLFRILIIDLAFRLYYICMYVNTLILFLV